MDGPEGKFTAERFVRFNGEGTLRGICDININNLFVVKGVRVIEGKKGLFVSMPRQQGKNQRWYDSASPLTKEARAEVNRIVLEAYEQEPMLEEIGGSAA